MKSTLYSHVALSFADISLPSLDEAGKAFTAIGCHTLSIATVGGTNWLTAELLGPTIARRAVTLFGRNALFVSATRLRAMRSTKETRLRIQSVTGMTGTGAVQVAPSMLAGYGTCMNTCVLLVAHEFRKAFAVPWCTAEAIATIIR